MSGTTISGVYLTGVTLSNAATQNPATVAAGATIKSSSGTALAGASGTSWNVANNGTVAGAAIGISLASGGNISNSASGQITGYEGVIIKGGDGTVQNSGSVTGGLLGVELANGGYLDNATGGSIVAGRYGVILGIGATLVNAGSIHQSSTLTLSTLAGVVLSGDGAVTNTASGLIAGSGTGVIIEGAGNVDNSGVISGSRNVGIYLQHGGMVTNAASASIAGGIYGVEIAGGPGVVLNSGSITSSSTTTGGGIVEKAGGSVTNEASGSIAGYYGIKISGGAGTVVNSGTLAQIQGSLQPGYTSKGPGSVVLGDGGSVTNTASGKIQGHYLGVSVEGATGTVINYGTISVDVESRPNYYTYNLTNAIGMKAGGSVTNEASASIVGDTGVSITGSAGTVVNSGTISGIASIGVYLGAGGYVTNASGATIHGGYQGIRAVGSATIYNSGKIDARVSIPQYYGHDRLYGTGVDFQSGRVINSTGASISAAMFGVVIRGDGTFVNYGSVTGAGSRYFADAVDVGSSGSVINEASGYMYGDVDAAGTVTNAGTIVGQIEIGNGGRFIDDPGSIILGGLFGGSGATLELARGGFGVLNGYSLGGFGTVQVDSGATWVLTGASTLASGSSLINSGTLALSGATLSDAGGVINNGRIELDPSTMSVASLSGTGTVSLDSGSTLAVQGAVSAGQDIVFTGSGGHLDLATPSDFGGTISGFTNGDIIDLTSVADVAGSSADMDTTTNVLTVTEGGTSYQFQFDKTEHFAGEFFHLASDHNGSGPGTLITENQIACYRRGTLIATGHGEVPVEALAIGDEIMTASGAPRPIKWIGRRSYHGRFIVGRKDILPICFKAGSIDDGVPRRDLWISPHHAMLLDGVLIEAKDLINGVSIVQAENVEEVEYFHIELDSHDVILAEGAPSETFVDDDSRGMFHNAQEYALLYPEAVSELTRYCAPRIDVGFELETIRQRLARRAGLISPAPQSGRLRGHVDLIGARSIEGWAQNPDHPEAPVCLDIHADGRLIGRTLANRYRADLKKAGLGSGRHAFVFRPVAGALPSPATIEVRRSLDGAPVGTTQPPGAWRVPLSQTGS